MARECATEHERALTPLKSAIAVVIIQAFILNKVDAADIATLFCLIPTVPIEKQLCDSKVIWMSKRRS